MNSSRRLGVATMNYCLIDPTPTIVVGDVREALDPILGGDEMEGVGCVSVCGGQMLQGDSYYHVRSRDQLQGSCGPGSAAWLLVTALNEQIGTVAVSAMVDCGPKSTVAPAGAFKGTQLV